MLICGGVANLENGEARRERTEFNQFQCERATLHLLMEGKGATLRERQKLFS